MDLLAEEEALLEVIGAELAKMWGLRGSEFTDEERRCLISKVRAIPVTLATRFGSGDDWDPVVRRSAVGALIASVVHLSFSARGKTMDLLPERAAAIREHVEAVPYINKML